jgi:hypothetical protein
VSDLTPEELDQARAAEASRRSPDICGFTQQLTLAARLAREGWTPTPKVDPDLLAAREWAAKFLPFMADRFLGGKLDNLEPITCFLAGIKHGRANP